MSFRGGRGEWFLGFLLCVFVCGGGVVHASGTKALGALLAQLSSPKLAVRSRAIRALQRTRRGVWAPVLAALHQRQPTKMRLAAAFATTLFATTRRHRSTAPWDKLWLVLRVERDGGVGRYLIKALEAWKAAPAAYRKHLARRATRDRDLGLREEALAALGRRARRLGLWRRVLRQRLRSAAWRQRRAALQELARVVKRWRRRSRRRRRPLPLALAPARLLPLLRLGLADANQRVNAAAAIASAALGAGARPLFPLLQQMLGSPSWRLRYAGAEAFQRLGRLAAPAMRALARGLEDGNWGVRYSSSHALAKIGVRALPLLRKTLSSPSTRARLAATDTLLRMRRRPRALYVRLLRRALRDRQAIVRFAAIRGLKKLPVEMALSSLTRATRDRDWRIREAALQGLLRWSPQRPPMHIVKPRLIDRSGAVREAALALLARWEGARVQLALAKALADRRSLVRYQAALGLQRRRLIPKAVLALQRAAATPHRATQAAVLVALASGGVLGQHSLSRLGPPGLRMYRAFTLLLWGKGGAATVQSWAKEAAGLIGLGVVSVQAHRLRRLAVMVRLWLRASRVSRRGLRIDRGGLRHFRRLLAPLQRSKAQSLRRCWRQLRAAFQRRQPPL